MKYNRQKSCESHRFEWEMTFNGIKRKREQHSHMNSSQSSKWPSLIHLVALCEFASATKMMDRFDGKLGLNLRIYSCLLTFVSTPCWIHWFVALISVINCGIGPGSLTQIRYIALGRFEKLKIKSEFAQFFLKQFTLNSEEHINKCC